MNTQLQTEIEAIASAAVNRLARQAAEDIATAMLAGKLVVQPTGGLAVRLPDDAPADEQQQLERLARVYLTATVYEATGEEPPIGTPNPNEIIRIMAARNEETCVEEHRYEPDCGCDECCPGGEDWPEGTPF